MLAFIDILKNGHEGMQLEALAKPVDHSHEKEDEELTSLLAH